MGYGLASETEIDPFKREAGIYMAKMASDRALKSRTLEALRLLRIYGGEHFDIGRLAGYSNSRRRQEILSALLGAKQPIARCGVNAIEAAFYAIAAPSGNCIAAREDAFRAWAETTLGDIR